MTVEVHDPFRTFVHLGTGPGVGVVPVTDDFWETLEGRSELHTGRLVTAAAHDTDWTFWEMHPSGDELVMVVSGSAHFLFDDGASVEEADVHAPGFVVVPAGVWHTADARGPAHLLFVTWGEGTVHRPR